MSPASFEFFQRNTSSMPLAAGDVPEKVPTSTLVQDDLLALGRKCVFRLSSGARSAVTERQHPCAMR